MSPQETPAALSRLVTVERTGSTNEDLRRALTDTTGALNPAGAAAWPHLSALRALHQTAGRGRAGRVWRTPAQGALTVSFVLRPLVPTARLDWLPLLAGLAVCDALAPLLRGTDWEVGTKWPNDVVTIPVSFPVGEGAGATAKTADVPGWGRTRKLAGILTELIAPALGPAARVPRRREEAPVVVLGVGVNIAQPLQDLPVPWAASLASLGVEAASGEVLSVLADALAAVVGQWESAQGDPDAGAGALGRRLREACTTLGQQVSVTTPAGECTGLAVDLRPGLVLSADGGRPLTTVSAGEVSLLRALP